MRLVDADKLAERVANLEAVALEQVAKYEPSEEHEKWKVWSAILNERTAFKFDLFDAPTVAKHGHWIPVKFRPMDSEEREYWEEQIGEELADADAVMFDCPMPEDGQEILVSYRKWISMDKCEIDGGCYGLEGNGDWDGVIAWMPLPEPYEVEE